MRHLISILGIVLGTTACWASGSMLFPQHYQSALAQFPDPERFAPLVYEKLPNFPLENQYRFREKKGIDTDNTLVKRLIQYHQLNRGRSPEFRLDWKLTLADYLGVNDFVEEASYPGRRFVKPNPYESDVKIIQELSRVERDQLIQALVDVFTPEQTATQPSKPPSQQLQTSPEQLPFIPTKPSPPAKPSGSAADLLGAPASQPQFERDRPKGDAQLLLPQ